MIFIPKKLKVGFQNRHGTYTGKLSYITYYDEKGNMRKEKSWEGWRDKKIEPVDYDNIPMEGFVLNKKVGDYHYDWNGRQAWCRVHDPRGFEFEISIDNLLHILENTNSIVGKGLEGEFVYAFDGGALVLLSTKSNEYAKATELSQSVFEKKKIAKKELVRGHVYKDKNGSLLTYLGDFEAYEEGYIQIRFLSKGEKGEPKKRPWFLKENREVAHPMKTLPYLIEEIGDRSEEYAELFEKYIKNDVRYNPIVLKEEVLYTLEEFKKRTSERVWGASGFFSHIWHTWSAHAEYYFTATSAKDNENLVEISENYKDKPYLLSSIYNKFTMTWEEAWEKLSPTIMYIKTKMA